jgi:hypothetical protein
MEELAPKEKGGERKRFVVTEDDISILKFVHGFRLVTIPQLEQLTQRSYTRLHKRVKGLYEEGLLKRIKRPQKRDVYTIGRPALPLLLSHGLISDEDAERRRREHELTAWGLSHELLISDIHIALHAATRDGPLELIAWREDERNTFEGLNGERVTVAPDAFFQLKDTLRGRGRTFFLEADRSSMPVRQREGSQRFLDKVERYRAFIETGYVFDRYGVRNIRIVIIAQTDARRDNLASETDEYLANARAGHLRKFFMFGTIRDVAGQGSLAATAPYFRQPGNDAFVPLFPEVAETQQSA